ncbi:MAG: DUF1571 domain-containing protein [Pirellulales bacterium]
MASRIANPRARWLWMLVAALGVGSVASGQAPPETARTLPPRPAYPDYRRPLPRSQAQGLPQRSRPLAGPRREPGQPNGRGVVPAFYPAPLAGETAVATATTPATQAAGPMGQPMGQFDELVPGEHPLLPAVRWAQASMDQVLKVDDYSCTMVKRERINGELGEQEFMFVKVRHEPFSVYMYFLKPARIKGQEVIYVAGRNGGKMQAHGTGAKKLFGTLSLDPNSALAMSGNRYPITDLGLRRLLQRLIQVGQHDTQFGECDVQFLPGTKINGRDCTCIQVTHPVPRREFIFHLARIYADTEHNLPIRYEAYEWPQEPGGPPLLVEEYTYLDLKFNNGFTDADFDIRNPSYDFR